uniref:Uncharacterized protein n=1 Tax=Physcomitrium patens TaxID=3218 RepID=A0A2K1JR39_PHYPA|nr:hypothetical protein PHYPA_016387 [Physcomitrium patens]
MRIVNTRTSTQAHKHTSTTNRRRSFKSHSVSRDRSLWHPGLGFRKSSLPHCCCSISCSTGNPPPPRLSQNELPIPCILVLKSHRKPKQERKKEYKGMKE